jgi:hypothetical protein
MQTYMIYAALHEESKEGWIWLPSAPGLSTDYVGIHNPRNGRVVVCERRTADENFRKLYDSAGSTIQLAETHRFVVMSAWYRERLGIFDTRAEVPLEIENRSGLWAAYRAFSQHPSPAIRMSIGLAALSIMLAILSVLEGLIALFR